MDRIRSLHYREGGGERQIKDDGERVSEGTKTIKGNLERELEGTRHERIKERALRGGQAISRPSSFCCWSLFSDCHVTLWAQSRGCVWHAASQKIYSRGQRSTGTRDPGIEVLVAPQGEEKRDSPPPKSRLNGHLSSADLSVCVVSN